MKKLLISLVLGVAIAGGSLPAVAETTPSPLTTAIERLEAEGYVVIDSHRSWLGRLVVVSTRDGVMREMVLNRATGTILSDRLFKNQKANAETPNGSRPDHGNQNSNGESTQDPKDSAPQPQSNGASGSRG